MNIVVSAQYQVLPERQNIEDSFYKLTRCFHVLRYLLRACAVTNERA